MVGVEFPFLFANSTNGDINVTVEKVSGRNPSAGGGCGRFNHDLDSQGRVIGGEIQIFQFDNAGDDCLWVLPHATLDNLIAHELGHVLGLANTPCSGNLMGPNWHRVSSPTSDECGWVDEQWVMPNEPLPEPEEDEIDPCAGGTWCENSPIVIDTSSGRYEFSSAADGAFFDLDSDGRKERLAWPASETVAFLFLDRNTNGLPDNGRELFGNYTLLANGEAAAHGFAALAELDSNGDASLDPRDTAWPELRLWFDFDRSGTATGDELVTLANAGIETLELDLRWSGRRDAHGNHFRWAAQIAFSTGEQRPYYDVYLRRLPH